MTSKAIYYCVYRITNLVEKKHYYGYKSSKIHPSKVIGVTYFSSSTNKVFKRDQKNNPQNYKYKIVGIFNTPKEALEREIRLHKKFDVGVNKKFYNNAKQTSKSFDTTGISIITYFDLIENKYVRMSKEQANIEPNRYRNLAQGQVTVRNSLGETFNVLKDDPRYLSGELTSAIKGQVTVYDEILNTCFNISKTDPRYLSGELKHVNKVFVNVKDANGNKSKVKKNDPRYLSGELVGIKTGSKNPGCNKGFFMAKDKEGTIFRIKKDDPRYLSGDLVSIRSGMLRVKNYLGDQLYLKTDDIRYTSGEFIHWRRKFIN